jgi:ATP-binding protein involved in chromosome partitioning
MIFLGGMERNGLRSLWTHLFLGEVPLLQSIREAGDAGRPAMLQGDSPAAAAFRAVLANLLQELGKKTD